MATASYEEGPRDGLRAAVLMVVETRFGRAPSETRQKLEMCPDERLSELLDRAITARSLEDVQIDDLLP